MQLPLIFALLLSAPLALADVSFSVPAAGKTYTAGTAFTVTWAESNIAPLITAFTTYDLLLFTGSNANPTALTTLKTAQPFTANDVSVTIPASIGGSNGADFPYFLGMKSTVTAGGLVINYSGRFQLSGMTGVFAAPILTDLATVSGSTGPPTVNQAAAAVPAAASPAAAAGAAQYGVPYNSQTGLIRYASMQPSPLTAITATNTAPLYPTSSVSIATTYLPIPSIQTTLTQAPAANSYISHANTASPAPQPADDMQKFLNRWKD